MEGVLCVEHQLDPFILSSISFLFCSNCLDLSKYKFGWAISVWSFISTSVPFESCVNSNTFVFAVVYSPFWQESRTLVI